MRENLEQSRRDAPARTLAGTPLRRSPLPRREAGPSRPGRPTARLLSLIAERTEPQQRGRHGLVALDRRAVVPQRSTCHGGVSYNAGTEGWTMVRTTRAGHPEVVLCFERGKYARMQGKPKLT